MKSSLLDAVVIGTSAGGVEALSTLLPALPADFPLPVIVVIHLPPHRDSLMAQVLGPKCHLQVREAEDKEPIVKGTVYFAPPDYHLLVDGHLPVDGQQSVDEQLPGDGGLSFALCSDAPVNFSRPSIDVLFESAAEAFGERLVGIVLSGANSDGADGLRAIEQAGGVALVQEPSDAQCGEMPRAALAACPGARTMRLTDIAAYLREAVASR